MPLEEEYSLTRKCLLVLDQLRINTMITTKADSNLIFRDIELLKNFKAEMTVLMGMSNMNQVGKETQNNNILAANKLSDNGIAVWAFLTPVLPHIMNVGEIISALNADMPIFLDKLRINANTIQAEKMTRFIERNFPEYIKQHDAIINENDESYFDDLVDTYVDNDRVHILF